MAGTPGGWLGRELTSLRFAALARRLGEAARGRGIEAPAFRSPPRTPGLRRSIRSESDGTATVSVTLRNRPTVAVLGDMVEGVVVASGRSGIEAAQLRDELWAAAAALLDGEVEAGRGTLPASFAA
ncbi:MAG: hypothetical protein ACFCVK_10900 [Acidimicrobiales bacterium]